MITIADPLVVLTPAGLYCPKGDFYIDPHRKVAKAVITHGHSDHARAGNYAYLATNASEWILKSRLGKNIILETVAYGETVRIGSVEVSFHPAGHVLGSGQVCINHHGRKWVITGDYKIETDDTCAPFEVVKCEAFITETTFALPFFKWKPQSQVFHDINQWWKMNAENNILSVIYAYSLGKAQRILAGVDGSLGPIYVHPSIAEINNAYLMSGMRLPGCIILDKNTTILNQGLVITPQHTLNKLNEIRREEMSIAYASGWMQTRSGRKSANADVGFVLSDHVDYPGLLQTVEATEAEYIFATHGYETEAVYALRQQNKQAFPLEVLSR
jgi:putative mRNA 3-end processing factor